MDKLTLLYIAFLAVAIILAVCFFALNENCKKSEQLNIAVFKEYRKATNDYNELAEAHRKLAEENKQLKACLLYERTKDDANVL